MVFNLFLKVYLIFKARKIEEKFLRVYMYGLFQTLFLYIIVLNETLHLASKIWIIWVANFHAICSYGRVVTCENWIMSLDFSIFQKGCCFTILCCMKRESLCDFWIFSSYPIEIFMFEWTLMNTACGNIWKSTLCLLLAFVVHSLSNNEGLWHSVSNFINHRNGWVWNVAKVFAPLHFHVLYLHFLLPFHPNPQIRVNFL